MRQRNCNTAYKTAYKCFSTRKYRSTKHHPGTQTIQLTICRSKPIKDSQLVTEIEAAMLLKAGDIRLNLISVYLVGDQEVTPYLTGIKKAKKKTRSDKQDIQEQLEIKEQMNLPNLTVMLKHWPTLR